VLRELLQERKEVFFFEKRTKKLLSVPVRAAPTVSDRGEGEEVKVFWFFFSKKNIFLPALLLPPLPPT
jgi:hypothetical protein